MSNVCGCNPPCGLPTCTGCGEDHGGHDHGKEKLCRDCDLEYMFTHNKCSECKSRRFKRDAVTGLGMPAIEIWGEPCSCPIPLPPTVWDINHPQTTA